MADSKCVTDVVHKVQLPLGPSTSDASANWDWAGKARSKCVTDVGHKVQLPLGPSTGDASVNCPFVSRFCGAALAIYANRGHRMVPPGDQMGFANYIRGSRPRTG